MSCPRRAGPAAGGARRRWGSGVRGREWPSWGAAVEGEEANRAVGLGRERTEGKAPLRTELTAALGRQVPVYAQGGPGAPFYRQEK
jgi:hypothetical protein